MHLLYKKCHFSSDVWNRRGGKNPLETRNDASVIEITGFAYKDEYNKEKNAHLFS